MSVTISNEQQQILNDISECKARMSELLGRITRDPEVDQKFVALGRAAVQQSFLHLTRAVLKPNE